jgi:O-Antigen ligase
MISSTQGSFLSGSNVDRFGRILIDCSRWFLLANFTAAAWLWGGTRPWAQNLIAELLVINLMVFLCGLLAARRMPRLLPALTLIILVIFLQGWLLSLNAYPGPGGLRILLGSTPGHIPWFPAFIDQDLSAHSMILVTGLLGAFCISVDLSANSIWLMRFWKGAALVGLSVVFLGLAQRFTNAPAIFWNIYENDGLYFFSVFRYHANAGAFINIVVPLTAPLAVLSVTERWWQGERILWIVGTLISCAAAFINASKAAMVITAAMILCSLSWGWIMFSRTRRFSTPLSRFFMIIAILATLGVLVGSFGTELSLSRWRSFKGLSLQHDRGLTYQVVWKKLVPRTGVLGSGPGSFETAFATVIEAEDLPVKGRWDMAHNDYLQTLSDWGWLGLTAFMAILGGAFLKGIKTASSMRLGLNHNMLGFGGAMAVAGVLIHACVDFPLQIASIQLVVAMVSGMLWGMRDGRNPRKANHIPVV